MFRKPDRPACFSFSPLSPPGAISVLVDLVSRGLHKIVIGHKRRNREDSSGPNDRKEPGLLGGANYVFCSLQLSIQILKGATEIILFLGN
jgi:hypothetical protein